MQMMFPPADGFTINGGSRFNGSVALGAPPLELMSKEVPIAEDFFADIERGDLESLRLRVKAHARFAERIDFNYKGYSTTLLGVATANANEGIIRFLYDLGISARTGQDSAIKIARQMEVEPLIRLLRDLERDRLSALTTALSH